MSVEHSPAWHGRKCRVTEAAEFLGLSTSTLAKMRLRGDGPPYAKLGRIVVYDMHDLNAYVEQRKRHSTSEAWVEEKLRTSTSDPGSLPE